MRSGRERCLIRRVSQMSDKTTEEEIPIFLICETLVNGQLREIEGKEITVKPNKILVLKISVEDVER